MGLGFSAISNMVITGYDNRSSESPDAQARLAYAHLFPDAVRSHADRLP
jgi:hypothetical protein